VRVCRHFILAYNHRMFLHREHDAAGPFVISQTAHAWMAWQVASHWGNRRFPRPAPLAEVLTAVLLHDGGWVDTDTEPVPDGDGRPRTFDTMPVPMHLEIWKRSVQAAAQYSRYAGLLVATHFRGLALRKSEDLLESDRTIDARAVNRFAAEMERLEASWLEHLASDPRYEHSLRGPGRQVNARILAACDRLSVTLCGDLELPVRMPVVGRDNAEVAVTFSVTGERTYRLDPWPLMGDALTVHCEGRRLRRTSFRSPLELQTAVAAAPVERFTFTLQRPSAPLSG
jgi:hypothetical protein